ncbi:hypothetical protein [Phyllobacterium zundukense]|uniref:Uncharacterized protein n=1 Tax=Phyllobacterium zundukense TaxID=1867719 RepID=A0A2N9VS63_9HYPH|nr:hypothetical protein [Phyllobacterium zundukense]ATU92754.1 hypothetical protein BLM14_14785 [Phyllobacterium zundukense]PIO42331.1 hypothetical protein B5P45_25240 [Phyllobacterium zundukense]
MTSQPDRQHGIPLTAIFNQRCALMAAACDPAGYPDDAMDSLMNTVSILDETIWSTPAKNTSDIAAKLRLALYYAEDREVWKIEAPEFLHAIALDWTRLNAEQMAAQIAMPCLMSAPFLMAAE